VRKGTKSFLSILSLGLVAAGYQAGQSTPAAAGFNAVAAPAATQSATTAATPDASASATPSASSTTSSTPSTPTKSAAPTNSATPTATPTHTATPTPTQTTAAPAPAAASVTKSGSSINYRYGTVQVSVTKSGGKITAVNMLQSGATGGRQGAFPYLTQYAVSANGSGFGNLGGATFTTDAFKQSLESALAKF